MSLTDDLDQALLVRGKARAPVLDWATVTQASPLRVRRDGEAAALDLTPDTLIAGLTVGQRVRIEIGAEGGVTVIGVAGGGDTGWLPVPLASGMSNGNPAPQYRIKNGTLKCRGFINGTLSAGSTVIGTLPSGSRPSVNEFFPLVGATDSVANGRLALATNGDILCRLNTGASASGISLSPLFTLLG